MTKELLPPYLKYKETALRDHKRMVEVIIEDIGSNVTSNLDQFIMLLKKEGLDSIIDLDLECMGLDPIVSGLTNHIPYKDVYTKEELEEYLPTVDKIFSVMYLLKDSFK